MMAESASLCVCVCTTVWLSLWPDGDRGVSVENAGESWVLSLVGSSSSVEIVEERK